VKSYIRFVHMLLWGQGFKSEVGVSHPKGNAKNQDPKKHKGVCYRNRHVKGEEKAGKNAVNL